MRVVGNGRIGTQFGDFCRWRSAGLPINRGTHVWIDPGPTANRNLVFYSLHGLFRNKGSGGGVRVKRVLFVCSQNRLRSPTAEQVFAMGPDLEVASAGTKHDAENPLSGELILSTDVIFVMERQHRTKLQTAFRKFLRGQRIICLDIPDNYAFMDPALVDILQARVARHLPAQR